MKEQIITYAMKLLASFVAYFAPSAPLIHAVLIMVLIDLITGVWAATTRAEKINSNGLRRTVRKMIGYVILIISGHIVDVTLLSGSLHLASIFSAYIGLTELQSVRENVACITGNDVLQDIWETIKEKIKSKYGNQ
ncbi:MAG: phage holin family protein [Chlorobium sp.]|nr:phage holin family protein [Chlorobium sp.]